MNWSKNKSVKLSMICIWIFAALLLAADVSAVGMAKWYADIRLYGGAPYVVLLCGTIYLLSVPAWICLWNLRKLLLNIRDGQTFVEENVRYLRTVSWCCAAAAAICLVSGFYYLPFFIVAIAAAFMMLIVRIVKNVFRQAVDMKSELDLTI